VTGGKLAITVSPQCLVVSGDCDQKRGADRPGADREVLISLHDNEDALFGVGRRAVSRCQLRRGTSIVGGVAAGDRAEIRRRGIDGAVRGALAAAGHLLKREINKRRRHEGVVLACIQFGTQRIAQIVDAYPVTIQAADFAAGARQPD